MTLEIGITLLHTCRSLSPARLAGEVEHRGFASLHVPEHSHIPASRKTPFPGASERRPDLPDVYWHLNGQITNLAMAAAVTEELVLGTAVTLIPQHDPIWLAKELATIDFHSGGRLELGVGFCWNREEYEAHGHVWSERRQRTADAIGIMRALWTQDEASFGEADEHLAPSWANPKPVQAGGPSILLGADIGPKTLLQMAQWADGWMPILTPALDLEGDLRRIRQAFEDATRDPASVLVTVMNGPKSPDGLERLQKLGVQRTALTIWSESPDDVLNDLDRLAQVRNSFLGTA